MLCVCGVVWRVCVGCVWCVCVVCVCVCVWLKIKSLCLFVYATGCTRGYPATFLRAMSPTKHVFDSTYFHECMANALLIDVTMDAIQEVTRSFVMFHDCPTLRAKVSQVFEVVFQVGNGEQSFRFHLILIQLHAQQLFTDIHPSEEHCHADPPPSAHHDSAASVCPNSAAPTLPTQEDPRPTPTHIPTVGLPPQLAWQMVQLEVSCPPPSCAQAHGDVLPLATPLRMPEVLHSLPLANSATLVSHSVAHFGNARTRFWPAGALPPKRCVRQPGYTPLGSPGSRANTPSISAGYTLPALPALPACFTPPRSFAEVRAELFPVPDPVANLANMPSTADGFLAGRQPATHRATFFTPPLGCTNTHSHSMPIRTCS